MLVISLFWPLEFDEIVLQPIFFLKNTICLEYRGKKNMTLPMFGLCGPTLSMYFKSL